MLEQEYRKPVTDFVTKVSSLLNTFDLYGMGVYLPQTEIEIQQAALKLHRDLSKTERSK